MSIIVDTVEHRIRNGILTAIDIIFAPNIELAARSKNESSGRDVISVTAMSERGEHVGITAFFEHVSEKNNSLNVLNTKDETRQGIFDEVNKLSGPGTLFERQSHTPHSKIFSDFFDENVTPGDSSQI